MNKPVVVIGAGGHAAVLVDILRQLNRTIIGLVSKEKPKDNLVFDGIPYYASDDDVLTFDKNEILLVNAIGSLPGRTARTKIQQQFKNAGYQFITVVSPHAIVSKYSRLAEGVQVMPGAIINANSIIGEGTIINSGAIIEHDCIIGADNHIAPGVTLSGFVKTGDRVHIGTGANVIQNISIATDTLIAAGATLNRTIEKPDQVFYPAIGLLTSKRNTL